MRHISVPAYADDTKSELSDASYWGNPVYSCTPGDKILIEPDTENSSGSNTYHYNVMYSGTKHYDAEGHRLSFVERQPGRDPYAGPTDATDVYLCPGFPRHAVVGKFGADGIPFLVGDGWEGKAGDHHLYLAVNDKKGQFHNNQGQFHYVIQSGVVHPTHMTVDPTKGWQKLHGPHYKSHQLEFRSSGEIVVGYGQIRNPNGDRLLTYDLDSDKWNTKPPPNAGPHFLCPGLPEHALVGKIDNGEPFLIGRHFILRGDQNADGTLWVAVNESKGGHANNTGSFSVLTSHYRG